MYLLEVESDDKVLSYSFIIIFPYLNIINSINISNSYKISYIVSLIIILVLIYFERVFKLKNQDKNIIEITIFSLLFLYTFYDILIFNFIISAFYIFYGLLKKKYPFIIFGVILLIITLLINLYNLFENAIATYVLLVIGFLMLGCVFYIEAKKTKINKNQDKA